MGLPANVVSSVEGPNPATPFADSNSSTKEALGPNDLELLSIGEQEVWKALEGRMEVVKGRTEDKPELVAQRAQENDRGPSRRQLEQQGKDSLPMVSTTGLGWIG